jgi:hypothetical protein
MTTCGTTSPATTHEAIIELLMLTGCYRTVGYLVNGLRLPLELNVRRFADLYAPAER